MWWLNIYSIYYFKPRFRAVCHTGLWACGFSYEFPGPSSFDCEAVKLASWAACRRGCLKVKAAHANRPALSLGRTPELLLPAACCPSTDMLLVVVSSICVLCNHFHLSSSRSATSLQSQNLVNTNHVYSQLFLSFYCGGSESLKWVIKSWYSLLP